MLSNSRIAYIIFALLLLCAIATRAHLADHPVDSLPELTSLLDSTGFQETILIYDLKPDRLMAILPSSPMPAVFRHWTSPAKVDME